MDGDITAWMRSGKTVDLRALGFTENPAGWLVSINAQKYFFNYPPQQIDPGLKINGAITQCKS